MPESLMTIHAENLSKRFNREWIFKNLNYQFNSPSTYAITGPNGSGKSTLLQILWGQMPPSAGTLNYSVQGHTIDIQQVYKHIAIATPYQDLIEEFTLREHLAFHFNLKKRRNNWCDDDMLVRMNLEHAMNKPIANFSSGMRQRLKLALAFYTEAKTIFLDEPSTNLDKKAFSWYKTELEEIGGKSMIFIASNQPEELPENREIINIADLK